MEGWRDDSAVSSTHCSYRGPVPISAILQPPVNINSCKLTKADTHSYGRMALDDCPDGEYKEATVCHILGNRQCRTMTSERGQSEEQSATMTVLPIELLACGTRGVLLNRLRTAWGS